MVLVGLFAMRRRIAYPVRMKSATWRAGFDYVAKPKNVCKEPGKET
ncbi:hypothetical protein [Burkholderia metallica]